MSLRKTEILDSTLREGEQCFGVFFPIEIKKQIALLLDEIGIDFIEIGHPAAAPSIEQAVSEISKLKLNSRLIAHARLNNEEIRLVKQLGVAWVGLFCSINDRSLSKYRLSKSELHQKIDRAVLFAKELGLSVKFTCEDASRTEIRELTKFFDHLTSLGVDRISYADTLGILKPGDLETIHEFVSDKIPFGSLHFHFHNDCGHAASNAITAIELGARCVDASISGIGERMGLVPLEELLAFFKSKSDSERGPSHYQPAITKAISLVKSSINPDHFRWRKFAHKSGIHINGIIKDPVHYESIDPDAIGSKRILVLSKLIGKSGLKAILSHHGLNCDENNIDSLLQQVKHDGMLELAEAQEIITYFSKRGLKRPTC